MSPSNYRDMKDFMLHVGRTKYRSEVKLFLRKKKKKRGRGRFCTLCYVGIQRQWKELKQLY